MPVRHSTLLFWLRDLEVQTLHLLQAPVPPSHSPSLIGFDSTKCSKWRKGLHSETATVFKASSTGKGPGFGSATQCLPGRCEVLHLIPSTILAP